MDPRLDTVLTCSANALSPSSRVKRKAITAIERALRHPIPDTLRSRSEASVVALTQGLRFLVQPHDPTPEERAKRWVDKAEAVGTLDALIASSIPRVVKSQLRQARVHLANSLAYSGGKPGDQSAFEALSKLTGLSKEAQALRKAKLEQIKGNEPLTDKHTIF